MSEEFKIYLAGSVPKGDNERKKYVDWRKQYCDIIKRRCFHRSFLDRQVSYDFEIRSSLRTASQPQDMIVENELQVTE